MSREARAAVGIEAVARAAGVSTATVSRALNDKANVAPATRRRVMAAAAQLGYAVSASASSLASGRTRSLGVVIPSLTRWFFSTLLGGIAAEATRQGYDITLYPLTPDPVERERVFDALLRRQRVDAVIVIATPLDDREARALAGLRMPTLAIGEPHPLLPTLSLDDVGVGRVATEHLLALGHRVIAHIGAASPNEAHAPGYRRRGYETALRAAGIPVRPDLVVPADFTIDGGVHAAGQLLADQWGAPTAIFAASDELAIGAIIAAGRRGLRVPADLSVIGVDGHELGELFGLTTVDQFADRQGRDAAAALIAGLEGVTALPVTTAELPFTIVTRTSTGQPRPPGLRSGPEQA